MSEKQYTPDRFLVVRVNGEKRLFVSSYGGYLGSDNWRLSSRIVDRAVDGERVTFTTESGAQYTVSIGTYGAIHVAGVVVLRLQKESIADGKTFDIYPSFEDYVKEAEGE